MRRDKVELFRYEALAPRSIFRFDECGHVPPLMDPSQITVVAEFVTAVN
jgi:hypothetical protein